MCIVSVLASLLLMSPIVQPVRMHGVVYYCRYHGVQSQDAVSQILCMQVTITLTMQFRLEIVLHESVPVYLAINHVTILVVID